MLHEPSEHVTAPCNTSTWTGTVPLPFSASGQLPFCAFLCCWRTAQLGLPLIPSHLSGRRDWGIENFISPTLLRNMRGKDIKKAISYHMKRNQVLLDPRQKVVCVPWVQGASQDASSISQGQRGNIFPLYGTTWGFSPIFSSCNFLCCACTPISLHSVFCCSLLVGLPDGKCGSVGWSCTDLLPIQSKLDVLVNY